MLGQWISRGGKSRSGGDETPQAEQGLTGGRALPSRGPVIHTSAFVQPMRDGGPEPSRGGLLQKAQAKAEMRARQEASLTGPVIRPVAFLPSEDMEDAEPLDSVAKPSRSFSLHATRPRPERALAKAAAAASSNRMRAPGRDVAAEPAPIASRPAVSRAERRSADISAARRPAPAMPAHQAGVSEGSGEALLSAMTLLRAGFAFRRWILLAGLIGALAGGFLASRVHPKYTATGTIYFDPVMANVGGSTKPQMTPEGIVSIVESEMRVMTSQQVLMAVADRLHLTSDPEFTAGGSTAAQLLAEMQKAVKVARDTNTYVVSVTATTADAEKSARLADAVIDTFLAQTAASDVGGNETFKAQAEVMAQKVAEAEKEIEAFKTANGLVSADGGLISDKRLVAANEQLTKAQVATVEAQAKYDTLAKLKADALTSSPVTGEGSSATTAASPALIELQRQAANLQSQVSSLEIRFGARHPSLAAAKSSLAGIQMAISQEVQRILSTAQADLARAKSAEAQFRQDLERLKAEQGAVAEKQVTLRELQRKADAAKGVYEQMLVQESKNDSGKYFDASSIHRMAKPEVPVKADPPARSMLLIVGVFGGFVGGAMVVLFAAAIVSMVRGRAFRALMQELAKGN